MTATVAAVVYLVRTELSYVIVFRKEPAQDARNSWSPRGQIHVFSPRDAEALRVLPDLVVDTPRACLLSTSTPGRWAFIRRRKYVELLTDGVLTQPFCFRFLTAAGVPDLPVDTPLYLTFIE